ncbi:bifunctional riboflavin kinase/FAD synthetase [Peptoniphilus catoniae]|uniref:bifunctional riboflavin kinase/FAD synthetase n=1 Tax=Peptoniphilus catoniae TaxID=1660341 RepID=UPI0010FEC155|nr:bifunctional riboflavin kinase/FAD synthetase [Peptoniphilus catoniae]
MEIISIDKDYLSKEETVIALGNFDGVHRAHRVLLDRLLNMAKKNGLKSSILIFKTHTKNTINNMNQKVLTSNRKKYELLENLGVDLIYEMEFTKDVMKIKPNDFIENFLVNNLKIKGIVVGYDYRFGYKAQGDTELLKSFACKNALDLSVVDKVAIDEHVVSSTRIRNLISEGKIKEANGLLGYSYSMDCEVIHGKKLGSKMGFPTANLKFFTPYIIPKFGVYDSNIIINKRTYKAATNIGKNPTIENSGIRIEAHILNFNKDIYGEKVELELIDFIRPEITFDNIDDLFKQIKSDIDLIASRK